MRPTGIHIEEWPGPEAGAGTVVLVHGFMGSAAAWGELPGRLARDRTVLVPDLPGHGRSRAPRDAAAYSVERVAASLAKVVAERADGPVDWLGYSMGGRIVLAGVAEGLIRPRRLVLESSSPGLIEAEARVRRRVLDGERADALIREGLDEFVAGWLRLPLFATQARLPESVRQAEIRRRLVHDPAALAACLRGGGTGAQSSYWDALATITTPTTLVSGALDAKFGGIADRMASRLVDARHVRVADAGHAPHLERPDTWLEVVRSAFGDNGR